MFFSKDQITKGEIRMRKNFGAQGFLYPMPVLMIATYDEKGAADAMLATWGGLSGNNQISIFLNKEHKSVENILNKKAFTVSMADAAHVAACDYVGMVSANEVPDKLERAGFHTTKSEYVDAPLIDELSMTLECELISYSQETELLVGNIVNVSAEEKVLSAEGNIDPAKLMPITFDVVNCTYRVLGDKVGNACQDGLALK